MDTATQTRKAELEAELKRLNEAEEAEREARRKAFKREWKFELVPVECRKNSWLEVRDPTVTAYALRGTVLNIEAARAAGWSDDSVRGGSMTYLFNTLSGRIIKADGGGSIFISGRSYGTTVDKANEAQQDAERVYAELESFLAAHPEGGDVTLTILSQRHFGWR